MSKNAKLLRVYFENAKDLPYHGGAPCYEQIASEACMANRQPLYKNQGCIDLCKKWFPKLPARVVKPEPSDQEETLRAQNRRIGKLEKGNDNLVAEVFELRRKLDKLKHIEKLIEQGKRHIL